MQEARARGEGKSSSAWERTRATRPAPLTGQPATIPTIRRTKERIGQQKESNEVERGRGGPG
ncbi:uncharacterized protein ANIA_11329 [Aspergillus nidulans FGSC A4]|uniref:Uncharacterized protein n=1 Tax=Emericella nidulans (strain FGSC A4 / ATCC 38163 / CBS 112.46 / NRRL 194 / M139) TaxID=227321 RepID=C8VMB7_EMENI|nr:hypothetical protein [Aspergillus nidulans FGSC A4]CBF86331.1 TPA: hypothetical protein ANIA_11329 [Aspergillus nidulans FGSC A4]